MREKGEPLSTNAKPAHRLSLTVSRGKYQATCVCGWVSETNGTQEDVVKEYSHHTGLVERRR